MTEITNESIRLTAEAEKKAKWIKTARWIYWVLTIFFAGTMLDGRVRIPCRDAEKRRIDPTPCYPLYLMKILVSPKYLPLSLFYGDASPPSRSGAYAGYSFNLLGAAASHAFSGDSLRMVIVPLILLLMVLISYGNGRRDGCDPKTFFRSAADLSTKLIRQMFGIKKTEKSGTIFGV